MCTQEETAAAGPESARFVETTRTELEKIYEEVKRRVLKKSKAKRKI